MPIEVPEIRQQGRGIDRTWQWKFPKDGDWRDMNQDLSRKDVKTYRDRTEPYSSWEAFWRNVIPGQQQTQIEETVPGEIVDFDALIEKTNILPDYLKDGLSTPYMLMLSGLWAEVTGYNSELGEYEPGSGWNHDTRGGDEATEKEIDETVLDVASELADIYWWNAASQDRGYDIDWTQDNAPGEFLVQSQRDVERGIKYTDTDSWSDVTKPRTGPSLPPDYKKDRSTTVTEGDHTDSGRKVVGVVGDEASAALIAGGIDGAIVEPTGDGRFAVTVPPGQGGWGTKAGGQDWLDETGLGDSGNFEIVPGTEGQWYVREKADTSGQFDDRTAAEQWIESTGGAERFEAVPGPAGKWVVREKTPDKTYSTPTTTDDEGNIIPGTPGDMFEPTITEDPTGRRFGLDAQGRLQDFGYGMAGDITQESLAGYQVPHRSLDMIVAKAIERANWPLARAVQAFKDRPTERELLDYAAQYAESPADLAVLSAIARGEHMVQPAVPLPEGMGTGMGQATRIGPPGEVYTSAYKSFIDSMNQGYVPNEDELRDLFDPKNDPAYIATKELADKYETEIGILRDTISEANKSASERIEKTQTNTLNMMSGMFDKTISSFEDIMRTTTGMYQTERDNLQREADERRTAEADAEAAREREREREREEDRKRLEREREQGKQNNQSSISDPVVIPEAIPNLDLPTVQKGLEALEPYDPGSEFAGRGSGPIRPAVPEITSQRTPASTPSFQEVIKDTGAGVGWLGMSAPTPTPAPTPAPASASDVSSMAAWGFAEGGVVQGPTMALLGEKEPEFIVPFSKVDEFKRGLLPMGKPRPTHQGSTVAKFEDSIPRFANGGMVTGPRFGGVTGGELQPYGENGAYVRPETRKELELGAEGIYGADGISRAPRIPSTDFQSLVQQYATPNVFLNEEQQRRRNVGNIPEYELRQRLGASEFAGTNPAQHPIGIQQLMAGRPISRPRSLMTAANMPTPSGQALKNMLPSELAYYQKMGRQAGIPQEQLEREMRAAIPGGTRRTPLRMGARRVRQA